jgi:hypothetical protein
MPRHTESIPRSDILRKKIGAGMAIDSVRVAARLKSQLADSALSSPLGAFRGFARASPDLLTRSSEARENLQHVNLCPSPAKAFQPRMARITRMQTSETVHKGHGGKTGGHGARRAFPDSAILAPSVLAPAKPLNRRKRS